MVVLINVEKGIAATIVILQIIHIRIIRKKILKDLLTIIVHANPYCYDRLKLLP